MATDLREALVAVVGPAHVQPGEERAAYAIDGQAPPLVVFPGSVAEVSGVLALGWDRRLGVIPAGSGTRLGWGGTPRRLDAVLALSRLDRILAHEPADMTMSVEAGARLGAVNDALAAHGQRLPLDPARAGRTTIGGLIATGAAGPYRARYGTMRDLLLGVTAVRADGTVIHGGGRVVKNVTGYDMPKLMVGALGTLAVVVEAHLRVHPRPAEERSWLVGFPGAEAALAAAMAVRETALVPSRLELLDGAALAAVGQPAPPAAALAVTIGGLATSVRKQGDRLAELCRAAGGQEIAVDDWTRWWSAVSDSVLPDDPGTTLALRIGVRPGDLGKAWKAVEAAAPIGCRAIAEAANGVLHAVLPGVATQAAAGLVDRVRAALAPLDGTCMVEHAPPGAKPGLDVWGAVGAALPTMARLKSALDARGILNPGRFVGGI